MSTNKFERKALKQIEEVNEGLLSGIAKLFMSRKVRRQYKSAYKIAKDDPELQAAFQGLKYHHEKLKDLVDSFCDRFPDHKSCK